VGVDPGGENICVRDCNADICAEITPCEPWWISPDIYIDNNGDGTIDAPAPGIENILAARVRNPGGADAANVTTDFYFVDPAMGLRFPGAADHIGTANTPLIGAGGSEVAEVRWVVPLPPPEVDHYCIGAVAVSADDPQNSERPSEDDNVAQINYQALVEKAGDAVPLAPGLPRGLRPAAQAPSAPFTAVRRVLVCNPLPQTCQFQIVIGSPPDFDDAVIPPDWVVALEFTAVVLAPGQCVPLRVFVTDNDPVHLDQALVPLSLICQSTPVGGDFLEFNIDNVRPRAPCTIEVTRRDPPATDFYPSKRAIRISWDDDDLDALGFPEQVERWRIHRDASQDFVPSPVNLIAETCIDDDPRTIPYDHFADVPDDTGKVWYKLVALDRAGNASDPCSTQLLITAVETEPVAPAAFRLAQNAPNPFSSRTRILFSLPREGVATLRVYTPSGRLVREIADGWRRAGTHEASWDGRDDRGRPAASGIYVCRLTYAGLQVSRRVLLTR